MTSKTSLSLCFTAKTFCNAFRQMKKALQTQYANHRAKLQNWFDFFFVLITGCLFRELHFPATKRDSVSGVKLCNSACGICCENFPPNCAWQGEEVWWLPRRVMGSLFCACLKCCSPAARCSCWERVKCQGEEMRLLLYFLVALPAAEDFRPPSQSNLTVTTQQMWETSLV